MPRFRGGTLGWPLVFLLQSCLWCHCHRPHRVEMHNNVRLTPVMFVFRGPQTTYQQFFGNGRHA